MKISFIIYMFFLIFNKTLIAQDFPSIKQYIVKISQNVHYDEKDTRMFLKRICVADSVRYNALKNIFCIYTHKELNKNIIDGKLQKNATPLSSFEFVGVSNKDLLTK